MADERRGEVKTGFFGKHARARGSEDLEKKRAKENKLSEKADKAAKSRARKKDKKQNKAEAAPRPEKIEIRRGKRVEPLGERLDYPGGFPVYLSRYVLFGGDSPRAAMRFYNGSEARLTGLRFTVTEKNADGKVVAEYPLERRGLNAERETEFSVPDTAVSEDCSFLEVAVTSAVSDPYEYVVEGDGVTVRYGVGDEIKDYYFREKHTCTVRKRKRIFAIISAAAVAAAALAVSLVSWRLGAFGGETRKSADIDGGTYITVTENVEA